MLSNVTIGDRFRNWAFLSFTKTGAALKRFLPFAIVWRVWEERNRRCFDEQASSLQQIIVKVMETVWGWCSLLSDFKEWRLDRVIALWESL